MPLLASKQNKAYLSFNYSVYFLINIFFQGREMGSKHVCLWIFKSGLYVKGKIRTLSLTQEDCGKETDVAYSA